MDSKYKEYRKEVLKFFKPENIIEDTKEEFISPSGKYLLSIEAYSNGKNLWAYSRGIVTRINDEKVIADVKRNLGSFWHAWCEHGNGNEYLLCGEDYQGQTIVNLTKEDIATNFPTAGYDGYEFCWTAGYSSPNTKILAIDGRYWSCPNEMVFFDFREPDNLPYKELKRIDSINEAQGWQENDTFLFSRLIEIRKSDGKDYDDLSYEEQDLLDKDNSLIGYREQIVAVPLGDLLKDI